MCDSEYSEYTDLSKKEREVAKAKDTYNFFAIRFQGKDGASVTQVFYEYGPGHWMTKTDGSSKPIDVENWFLAPGAGDYMNSENIRKIKETIHYASNYMIR